MSAHGVILLFTFALWIAVALVVAGHASENGRSGALWGIATFFFGLFAIVAYLFVSMSD